MFIHRNTFLWIGAITAMGFLSLGTTFAIEPESNQEATEESLSITAGDIFEILAVSDIRLPQYSWILTRNRQFLQAGQNAAFRNRFLEPGTYTLNAQLHGRPGEILSHTITIYVTPRSTTNQEKKSDRVIDNDSFVQTIPFRNSANRIILSPSKKTLLIKPFRAFLALDLLPSIDTDDDRIAKNDQDTHDTFFQEEGTPLFLWLASPLTEKILVIHDTLDPILTPQMIHIVSLAHAQSQNMLTGEVQITSTTQDDGSIVFSVAFEGDTQPDIPLLYEWDFDDDEKSLVDAPVHTFVKSGTYNVNVQIRDLNTNGAVTTAQIPISVSNDAPAHEIVSPPPQPEEPEESPVERIVAFLPIIGIVVGIVLGLMILGTGILFILKKIKKGRSTEAIVARLEEKVVKEKDEEEPHLRPAVAHGAMAGKQSFGGQAKGFPIDQSDEQDIEQDKKKEKEPKKEEIGEQTIGTIKDEKETAFEESATPAWLKKEEQKELPQSTDAAMVPPWLGGTPKTPHSTSPTSPPPAPKPVTPPVPVAPQPVAPPHPPPPTKPVPPITAPTPPLPPKPVTPLPKPPVPSKPLQALISPTSPTPPSKPIEPPKPAVPTKPTQPLDQPIAFVHVDSIQPTKPSEPLKSPPSSPSPPPPKDSQISKASPSPQPIQPKKEDKPWI